MAAAEQPGALARVLEALRLVYFDGSITPRTLSGPSASTATAADSALSIPPDRPRITPGKPLRPT